MPNPDGADGCDNMPERPRAGELDSFIPASSDVRVVDARRRAFHLLPLITMQVFGLVCGLLGVRWSSAIVPPEVLGTFGILVSTHGLAMMATHLGLMQHVQKHWTARTGNLDYVHLLARAAVRPTMWLAIALAAVWVALRFTESEISSVWWLWMMAVNILAVVAQIAHSALQAEQRYWAHAVTSMCSSATRSFLPLLFLVWGGASVGLLGLGFLGSTLIWALVGLCFLRTALGRRRAPTDEPLDSPGLTMGTFMLVGLYGWVGSTAHRFFAAGALDSTTTGYFMLAANLTAIIPTMVGVIGYSYTFPALFAAARRGATDAELWRKTRNSVAGVMLLGQVGLLVLHVCGPLLLSTILDPRYGPSIHWILPTGGALLGSVSAGLFCNLFIAQNRERSCLGLVALSAGFRVAVIAVLTLLGDIEWLRVGLGLLPWPTLVLEYGFVRYVQRRDGESRRGPPAA